MGIKEAAKEIMKACEGIDEIEININNEEVDIYWENLRLTLTAAQLPKGISVIKSLVSLGARFE